MRLVIFDMDGTLIDSEAFIQSIFETALLDMGRPVPDAAVRRQTIGLSLHVALGQMSGLTGPDLDELVAAYRRAYLAQVPDASNEPLYAGASETVLTLADQPETLLGIATGKAMRGVNRVLELHGLTPHFVTKQTPDDNPSKPHPGMVLSAMAETGVGPERTIVVGDTSFDMEMAKGAGAAAVGVSWGYHDTDVLVKAGADVIVDEYAALIPAIDKLLERTDA